MSSSEASTQQPQAHALDKNETIFSDAWQTPRRGLRPFKTYSKGEEQMPKCLPMKRSHILAFFMATALAMPAAAQQLSEQEARNAVQSTIDVWVNAAQKKDAAAIAALYTEKSMRVTPDGILYGRAAIEKNLEEGLKVFSGISLKLDQVHVLGNGAIEATGTWAGTLQTPNGPVSVNGFWGVTDVRDGNTWKADLDVYNMASPPAPQEAKK
jgi:uncharacterized protein (TIGR02246 family)